MKKNILLFVIDSMRIGGIQKALINLLQKIDYSQNDIYLLSFKNITKDDYKIPPNVHILRSSLILDIINNTTKSAKTRGMLCWAVKCFFSVLCKIFGAKLIYTIVFKFCTIKTPENIEIAISYTNNGNERSTYFGVNKFVIDHVRAERKVAYIHVDYEVQSLNTKNNALEYSKFDRIICVSKGCFRKFIKYNNKLHERCRVLYNIVANEELLFERNIKYHHNNKFNIVSVGRMDANKNLMQCINIAEILVKENIDFEWVICGSGPDFENINTAIRQKNLSNFVKLTGYVKNTYCYIHRSDILVSTSKTESFGMVIQEAILLKVPVVSLNYPALDEILKNGMNGIIIFNDEPELYAREIINIVNSKKHLYELRKQCKSLINDNDSIRKFWEMINELKKS